MPEQTKTMTAKEARKIVKESGKNIRNEDVTSYVRLQNINKIYPNGIQAVYDFNIDIQQHEFIVLVGPSGCGKSTTLRMIAGLEEITSGELYIDKVLSNYLPSKERDISMVFQSYALYPQMTVFDNIAFPLKARKYDKIRLAEKAKAYDELSELVKKPEEIKAAIQEADNLHVKKGDYGVFFSTRFKVTHEAGNLLTQCLDSQKKELSQEKQEAVLKEAEGAKEKEANELKNKGYTVGENYQVLKGGEPIHYMAHLTKDEIRDKVFSVAKILDLGPYLDRKPKELSGGQMQRVALGRAIVRDAKIFLMDEPLSNLDAKLRVAMRSEIVRIHERIGATTIYVTHDQTEAMTMATRIVIMSKGWVQQIGAPQEIYNHPANIFVATFIGSPAMNIFNGVYENGVLTLGNGYQVSLPESFQKTHDDFYKQKIAQIDKMLETNTLKKLHALEVFDALTKKNTQAKDHPEEATSEYTWDDFAKIVDTFTDEDKEAIKGLLAEKEAGKGGVRVLRSIRKHLLNLNDLTSADLSNLHNSQVFNKDQPKKEDTLYYKKKSKEKKKGVNYHLRGANVVFDNNLYEIAINLKAKLEEALKGKHDLELGVRPEYFHLQNEFSGNASTPFTCTSDVIELMGSELLLHTAWNGSDVIAKISTGTLVKPHTEVQLVFEMDKIHLFDPNTGDTIAEKGTDNK